MKRYVFSFTGLSILLIAITGFVIFQACEKREPVVQIEIVETNQGEVKLTPRGGGQNNQSGQSNHQDSFIYQPTLYGSKMIVLLEARTPGRKNSYLSKLRRVEQTDPNARFYHPNTDVTSSDSLPYFFTDTFFICRRIRI